MVSIIMPAYNASTTICEALDSIIAQTFTKWELIVINDSSTDNTKEIVEDYMKKDGRIRLVNNEVNMRVANTRNVGMNNAKYAYIAFLDSDDAWHEEKLAKQIQYMDTNNIAFCATNYEIINEKSTRINKYVKSYERTYKQLLRGNTIGTSTVIINKDKVAPFAFKNIGHEDYALWLTLLKVNKIKAYAISENLTYHRLGNVSLSSNKFKAMKWTWRILRHEEKINIVTAAFLFISYAVKALLKIKKM